jgi:toxin ParE1/3/4
VPYRVRLTARAARDLEELYDSIGARTSPKAFEWFNALVDLIYSLDRFPERGAVPPESKQDRQLLFGKKPHIYRIIYEFDKRKRVVNILHIRHGARVLPTK